MKKTLLLTAAAAVAGSALAGGSAISRAKASDFTEGPKAPARSSIAKAPTRAEGDAKTFDFTYASNPMSVYSLNGVTGGKSRVYLGFEMKTEDIKMLKGSKVVGFKVYSPLADDENAPNEITEGEFFYSFDLQKADFVQKFEMSSTAAMLNDIVLDSSYTISGDETSIFFGYSFIVPKKDDMYYLVTDGVPNDPGAGISGISNDESFPKFSSFAPQIGALCMSVTLQNDSFPKLVTIDYLPGTICLPLNKESIQPVALKATSDEKIESVGFEYELGGKLYSETVAVNPAVPAGVMKNINVNLSFPALTSKLNETVEFKVTTINGSDNMSADNVAAAQVGVVEELPEHQTLYEEYTGLWCGYCPRGFAALEYIRKNYPEFVTVAFHYSSSNSPDIMQTLDFYPTDISSFPSAVLNRRSIMDPYGGTGTYNEELPIVGDIKYLNSIPTAWKIDVNHVWESENILMAKANVTNVVGYTDQNYKIAYILVTDGLSGTTRSWYQSNYMYTNRPVFIEELNQFCLGGKYSQASVRGLVYNDVVLSGEGVMGIDGSVPTALEADQEVSHSFRFDLSKISSTLIPDRNKLRVVAAVLDERGNVVNCTKDEVNDFDPNAVEGIFDANAPVEYFNLNGMKVAEPTEGIYIRRQGGKAEKVIIR